MDKNRMFEFVNSDLSKALGSFHDVLDMEEAERDLEGLCASGYPHTVEKHIAYIETFLASNPDKEWVRDFVSWEMNWPLPDDTGELQMQWLRDALAVMQKVLAKYNAQSAGSA